MKVDFHLHLFADHGWPPEYDISEDGRRELDLHNEIKEGSDLRFDIDCLIARAKFYGAQASEQVALDNIKKTRRGLAQFINGVEAAGPWLTLAMLHDEEEFDDENREESHYWEDEDRAFRLESFIERAKLYESLLADMEGDSDLPIGRAKNEFAHTNAVMLAELFQEHGIPLSSYKDGKYFQVFRIVLNEIFPDIKPEAYRRYATSALDEIKIEWAQNSA